jgi:predicted outer membrane repeat protein
MLLAMSLIALGIIPCVSENTASPMVIQDSLQSAINAGGTVYLKEGIYKQTVKIDKPVTLVGAGPGKTFIDGDKKGSVFTIGKSNPDIDVKLSGMTIQGGAGKFGGGINNSGRLIVDDTTISGNTAEFGGGIYIEKDTIARATINNVNIVGNSVTYDGAGVYNCGGTLIINSGTITENTAEVGAGVFNDFGTMVVNGGTITKNTATKRCGGVLSLGDMDLRGGSIVDNALGNVYTPSLT